MRLTAFFIKFIFKVSLLLISSLGLVLLACYLLGPPPISDALETVFYDEEGKPFPKQVKDKPIIQIDKMNNLVIEATIAIEDKHFYDHFGFDIKRIVRAFLKNIKSASLKEGASTITQQYARNLYLTHDKTWQRKLKEAIYTIRLEMFYSKDDILEGYLNTIYYGHGAYGIEDASYYYFNKGSTDLSIAELSLLVGIPKGPTYYSPFNNEENAFTRQNLILNVLHKEKIINDAEYYEAKSKTLKFSKKDPTDKSFAPYFTDFVLSEASDILRLKKEEIINRGYHIYTTLNKEQQQTAEDIIKKQVLTNSDIQIGTLSIEPKTGAIKTMIGGRSYKDSPFNRATHAKRAVGSTFKPIVYYTALENGFSPHTMLTSEPTIFTYDKTKTYEPKNFNHHYAHKPITLLEALAVSDNIYAVKTNMYVSAEEVIKRARKFGISSDLPNVPSLALGSASITVNEMTQAYGMISNGGKQITNYSIEKITDYSGKTIYEKKHDKQQIFNENKTFVLSQMLSGMFDTGLNSHLHVTGASISHLLTHKYYGKSGTTDTDSWMIGYSEALVTSVWLGYDDNRPITDQHEKTYAKTIWAHMMEEAHKENEATELHIPSGVVAIQFDHTTGKIATDDCPSSRLTYFEKGTEPRDYCQLHKAKEEKKDEDDDDASYFKQMFDLFFGP